MIASDEQVNAGMLLYIEPREPASAVPVIDAAVRKMCAAFRQSQTPGGAWAGCHFCFCGAGSSSTDYLLPGGGLTNSLCVHYLAHHRSEVPPGQLARVDQLNAGEAEPTEDELQGPSMIADRIREGVSKKLGPKRLRTWKAWGLNFEALVRDRHGGLLPPPEFYTDVRREAEYLYELLWHISEGTLPLVRESAIRSHGSPQAWGAVSLAIPGWSREAWVPLLLHILRSNADDRRSLAMKFHLLGTAARAAVPAILELMATTTGDHHYDVSLALEACGES